MKTFLAVVAIFIAFFLGLFIGVNPYHWGVYPSTRYTGEVHISGLPITDMKVGHHYKFCVHVKNTGTDTFIPGVTVIASDNLDVSSYPPVFGDAVAPQFFFLYRHGFALTAANTWVGKGQTLTDCAFSATPDYAGQVKMQIYLTSGDMYSSDEYLGELDQAWFGYAVY